MAYFRCSLGGSSGGSGATLTVSYSSDLYNATITATHGTTILTKTASSSGSIDFNIPEEGLWTISSTISSGTYSKEVDITLEYDTELTAIIDGETALPVNDIGIWLQCAEILNKNYTTLAEVLADDECFTELLGNSNACAYMARSTDWALQEGLVPVMTDNTHPSGEVSANSIWSGREPYKVFDGNDTTWYTSVNNEPIADFYLAYKFPSPTIVNRVRMLADSYNASSYFDNALYGGNSLSSLTKLSGDMRNQAAQGSAKWLESSFVNDTAYTYYVIKITGSNQTTANGSNFWNGIYSLQFYSADITTNPDAMARIGKYDYCSEKLLSNATWAEAIANSEYFESVLNTKAPVMTSNTTPSGECIYSGQLASNAYYAWKAFNPSEQKGWLNDGTTPYIHENNYIGYEFTSPTKVYICEMVYLFDNTPITIEGKIQAYDGTDWIDVTDNITVTSNSTNTPTIAFISGNTRSCTRYRFLCTTTPNGHTTYGLKLQFYGRADSTVYSPLVPVMTSNTTPEGECGGGDSDYRTDNYKAFDGNGTATMAYFSDDPSDGSINWYHFTSPKVVKRFSITTGGNISYTVKMFQLVGSNDGINWTDLSPMIDHSSDVATNTKYTVDVNNDTAYSYYGIRGYRYQSAVYASVCEIQFYSQYTKGIIYSAANDTIYYSNNGTNVPVATTDSNGDGKLDFASLTPGTYTLYSTVAKDPSNLSNPYTMQVKVTKNTKELYFMPLHFLYWYGKESNNMELETAANGWSTNNSNVTITNITTTRNTNNIALSGAARNYCGGYGNKYPVAIKSKICAIMTSNALFNDSGGGIRACRANKYIYGEVASYQTVQGTMQYKEASLSNVLTKYFNFGIEDNRTATYYAVWGE